MALFEIRLQPTSPWRSGHHQGDRERVDTIYHSDAVFSAVTHAMKTLGWLEEWLGATVTAEDAPVVRFSSFFPFIGETRLITPPRVSWPPSGSGKLYLNCVRLVPLEVARNGIEQESQWMVDGASGCLLPAGSGAPFDLTIRSGAAVDRLSGSAESHRTAGLEFAANGGWWGLMESSGSPWDERVKSAIRLLADSGFGGERALGWGRAAEPVFQDAAALFPDTAAHGSWWLLGLYSPHEQDRVDWGRGDYSTVIRSGWSDSGSPPARKKSVRMIEEGSVLVAPSIRGRAVDVAPDGFQHPAWRAGFAVAIPMPPEVQP